MYFFVFETDMSQLWGVPRRQRYLPMLAGSAYEGVTLRHVLTMSSGTHWVEDYADRTSHVNRYSKSLADRVPGGVLKLMASLERAHPPGTTVH